MCQTMTKDWSIRSNMSSPTSLDICMVKRKSDSGSNKRPEVSHYTRLKSPIYQDQNQTENANVGDLFRSLLEVPGSLCLRIDTLRLWVQVSFRELDWEKIGTRNLLLFVYAPFPIEKMWSLESVISAHDFLLAEVNTENASQPCRTINKTNNFLFKNVIDNNSSTRLLAFLCKRQLNTL